MKKESKTVGVGAWFEYGYSPLPGEKRGQAWEGYAADEGADGAVVLGEGPLESRRLLWCHVCRGGMLYRNGVLLLTEAYVSKEKLGDSEGPKENDGTLSEELAESRCYALVKKEPNVARIAIPREAWPAIPHALLQTTKELYDNPYQKSFESPTRTVYSIPLNEERTLVVRLADRSCRPDECVAIRGRNNCCSAEVCYNSVDLRIKKHDAWGSRLSRNGIRVPIGVWPQARNLIAWGLMTEMATWALVRPREVRDRRAV